MENNINSPKIQKMKTNKRKSFLSSCKKRKQKKSKN